MSLEVPSLTPLPAHVRLNPDDALRLQSLLSNWSRRTRDSLLELLESSGQQAQQQQQYNAADEFSRRQKLFRWIMQRQRQLGQLLTLAQWTTENATPLTRVREIGTILHRRQQLMWTTTDMLHLIQTRAENALSATHAAAQEGGIAVRQRSDSDCPSRLSACCCVGFPCGMCLLPCTC